MNEIFISNENFETSITSLKSQSFGKDNDIYRFYYDRLKPAYKKYLLEHDLDKNRIIIDVTPDPKNRDIIKKYKHQANLLKSEKHNIQETLNNIFRGKTDSKQLLIDISFFDNRYILLWLESTASGFPIVAQKLAQIDKYVYSPFFKYLIVHEFYGYNAIAKWSKK